MKRVLVLAVIAALVCFPAMAMAQEHGKAEASTSGDSAKSYIALAMGLGLGIAVFGGAIGQSRGIAASVEAMARQPEMAGRVMGAMIIGLALIETLVIYMLLICFMLLGKM